MIIRIIVLFTLSIFLYSFYIRFVKRARQYEREEGLDSHKSKNGTVTMGGIIFAILPLFFLYYNEKIFTIVVTIFMYFLIGLVDDLLIIIKKNNLGIPPTLKLFLEVLIAGFAFYMMMRNNMSTVLDLKFIKIDIKWIYGLLILFILAASSNSFNLADGVDGLCAGMSLIIHITFMIISFNKGEYDILWLLAATLIPLFVFWCLNYPKAFLFMGDTGSLFLGSLYGIVAIYLNSILAFIILAIPFIIEALSVIIQVWYYKKTKRRIFKMAPIHHHLEMCGFSEFKIDLLFYGAELLLMGIVLMFGLY